MTYKINTIAAVFAVMVSSPAFSATVTLEFEGQGRLLPLGGQQQTFTRKLGSDIDFLQFRDSMIVDTGEVNSSVKTDIAFDFRTAVALNEANNTQIKFKLGNMDASYNTRMSYREKKDIVFRWNRINVPAIFGDDIAGGSQTETLLDEGGSLVTTAAGTNLSFQSSGPAVPTLSDTDNLTFSTPLIPIPNRIPLLSFATEATVVVTNDSNLFLGQLTGKLIATNRDTGLTRTESFALRNGEVVIDLDLAQLGTWDLAFDSLDIENVLFSDLTERASQRAALYSEFPGSGFLGGGCQDPFDKTDNGSLGGIPTCFFETGVEFLDVELKLFDNAPSQINYALTQGGSIGSITVRDPAISAIPLPASFPLYLAGLGGLALFRQRRART